MINAEIAPSYVIVRLEMVSEPLLRLDLAILPMNVRSNIRWHVQRNVSELLLLIVRGTIFQLYHDEMALHFDDMMSVFY